MKRYVYVFLIAATACFISTDLLGQGIRATVVGRVTDQSGAIVPGVKITITNAATNESRSAVTSDTGDYALPQLPPGDYNLTTEMTGFSKVSQRFVLETGQGARVDIVLKAGAITEEVPGTAIPPLVSTEKPSPGNIAI